MTETKPKRPSPFLSLARYESEMAVFAANDKRAIEHIHARFDALSERIDGERSRLNVARDRLDSVEILQALTMICISGFVLGRILRALIASFSEVSHAPAQ